MANNIDASAFTDEDDYIVLSTFAAEIRDHVGENGENSEIEALVSSVLELNDTLDVVKLDAPLSRNQVDARIFDALLSCRTLKQFLFPETLGASNIPALLRRAIPILENKQTTYCGFIFEVARMTAMEADEIFGLLQRFTSCYFLSLVLIAHYDEVVLFRSLARCIRESAAMAYLALGVADESARMQNEQFHCLCEAIGESSSLEEVYLQNSIIQEEHIERGIENLAKAYAKSVTLRELNLDTSERGAFTMDRVCQALSRTTPVKNFELCYRKAESGASGYEKLEIFHKTVAFKQVLSQSVPLGLWPRILAKAGTWTQEDSHSPLDFVFLLAKEKNDVLFRDVQRKTNGKKKLSGQKRKRDLSDTT